MRRLILVAVILLLLSLVPPTNVSEEDRRWTVMIYMGGGGEPDDISDQVDRDLEELMEVDPGPQVEIIVLADQKEEGDSRLIRVADGILHNMSLSLVNNTWDDEVDMSSPYTLRDFASWSLSEYPSEYTLLDLWGHGSTWKGMPLEGFDKLTIQEMEYALDGHRFDIIGFDSCTMGLFEVYLELKDNADYIVAAPQEVPLAGWPYDRITKALYQEPSIPPENLASTIVEEYHDWVKYNFQLPSGMTAVRTDELPIESLSLYTSELKMSVPHFYQELTAAKSDTQRFSPPPYPRDLYHFTMKVDSHVNTGRLRRRGTELREGLNRSVVKHSSTAENSYGPLIHLTRDGTTYGYDPLQIKETGWGEWLDVLENPPPSFGDGSFYVDVEEDNGTLNMEVNHLLQNAVVEVDIYQGLDMVYSEEILEKEEIIEFSLGAGHYEVEAYLTLDGTLQNYIYEKVLASGDLKLTGYSSSSYDIVIENLRTGSTLEKNVSEGPFSINLQRPDFCEPGDELLIIYGDNEKYITVPYATELDVDLSAVERALSPNVWFVVTMSYAGMTVGAMVIKRRLRIKI